MSILPILYFGTLSAVFYVVFAVWAFLKFVWKVLSLEFGV